MRTSRVSQDASRITKALSSRGSYNSGPVRRSLRQSRASPQIKPEDTENIVKKENSSSELSAPPDSPNDSPQAKPTSIAKAASRKRKRDNESNPGVQVKSETVETEARRSPRKPGVPNKPGFLKKARRQPAKRIKGSTGDVIKVEPPANWEKVYSITAEMRERWLAPVDTMGCESLAEDHRSPRDRRLQTLIALMLSSQTKDTVTAVAMQNLQQNLPGGFNLESLLTVEPPLLNQLIAKVGFHNNKTRYIKQTAEIIRDRFSSEIPDTIEGLVSLPGVGPKMAYLCMSAAWGRDEGIGVDVHVHRITNLWGWHKTTTPEQTRAELEAWLPREKWHDINHLLVGFGQTFCPPVGRKCGNCDLAEQGLCPSAVVPKEVKQRVKREVKIEVEEQDVVKEVVSDEKRIKLEKADEEAPPLVLTPGGKPQG